MKCMKYMNERNEMNELNQTNDTNEMNEMHGWMNECRYLKPQELPVAFPRATSADRVDPWAST